MPFTISIMAASPECKPNGNARRSRCNRVKSGVNGKVLHGQRKQTMFERLQDFIYGTADKAAPATAVDGVAT